MFKYRSRFTLKCFWFFFDSEFEENLLRLITQNPKILSLHLHYFIMLQGQEHFYNKYYFIMLQGQGHFYNKYYFILMHGLYTNLNEEYKLGNKSGVILLKF